MLTGRQIRKRGFTLVETVVTVGIIAALAAVVYPQVVKQFNNADPTRAAEDLVNIRTGFEAFTVNVKSQPGDIEDLANQIGDFGATDAQDRDSSQTGYYATSDSLTYLGPYLAVAIDTSKNGAPLDTVITTGYGASITNGLLPFDVNAADGGAVVAKSDAAKDFITVRIIGLNTQAALDLNELIDGANEGTSDDIRRRNGLFRCPGATYTSGQACFYLVAPVK